jgi:TATA box-binding protein-associated factor RNA polymerase I subunit A
MNTPGKTGSSNTPAKIESYINIPGKNLNSSGKVPNINTPGKGESSSKGKYSLSKSEQKKPKAPEIVKIPEPLTYETFQLYRKINRKLSTWHGDITRLEVDAVVNAANSSLMGGGGIDGAIHSAAGSKLRKECAKLKGCKTGFTKTTRAYNLPAKYILHTVGPIGENEDQLQNCYKTCLEECVKHGIKTVAFCGISTGIFGYPLLEASLIACKTVKTWMENPDNLEKIDRIIFCTFLDREKMCYEKLLVDFFPPVEDDEFIESYLKIKEKAEVEEEAKINEVTEKTPENEEVKPLEKVVTEPNPGEKKEEEKQKDAEKNLEKKEEEKGQEDEKHLEKKEEEKQKDENKLEKELKGKVDENTESKVPTEISGTTTHPQ